MSSWISKQSIRLFSARSHARLTRIGKSRRPPLSMGWTFHDSISVTVSRFSRSLVTAYHLEHRFRSNRVLDDCHPRSGWRTFVFFLYSRIVDYIALPTIQLSERLSGLAGSAIYPTKYMFWSSWNLVDLVTMIPSANASGVLEADYHNHSYRLQRARSRKKKVRSRRYLTHDTSFVNYIALPARPRSQR